MCYVDTAPGVKKHHTGCAKSLLAFTHADTHLRDVQTPWDMKGQSDGSVCSTCVYHKNWTEVLNCIITFHFIP